MLILPYTNGFRIDLNQLSQRILHTSCNGCGTSLSYIKIGKFICSKLTCRVNRSTRLICNYILNLRFRNLLQHINNNLLRLSGSSTISNRNQGNAILLDHSFYCILRSANLLLVSRSSWINNCGIQNFSSRIYNSQLTACTEGRVPSKDSLSGDWRLHEKLLQIFAKYFDSSVLCLLSQVTSDLALDCRSDQTLVTVLCHFFQNRCSKWIVASDHLLLKVTKNIFFWCSYLDSEEFLFLTTVQRQHTMSSQLLHRLFKLIIHLIYRLCLRIFCRRTDSSFFGSKITDVDSIICLIGNMLCNNVLCTSNGICHRSNLFFLGNKGFCFFLDGLACHLKHNNIGQRLQTFFLGNCCPGTSLRTVWAVKILYYYQCLCCQDLCFQLFCQFSLVLNAGKNLILLVFQISKISQSFVQVTKLLII